MKSAILAAAAVLLAGFGANANEIGNATHDQLLQSLVNFNTVMNVLDARNANTSPNFTDPNTQAMAQALSTCTVTNDRHGNSTIIGDTCPTTSADTLQFNSPIATLVRKYTVTNPSFQAYNSISSLTWSITATLGENDEISASLSGYLTQVDIGGITYSGTENRSATQADKTFDDTIQLTAKSNVSQVVYGQTEHGHVDATGTEITDSSKAAQLTARRPIAQPQACAKFI